MACLAKAEADLSLQQRLAAATDTRAVVAIGRDEGVLFSTAFSPPPASAGSSAAEGHSPVPVTCR